MRLTACAIPAAMTRSIRLMAAVLDRTSNGELIRKAGVMGIVIQGGIVSSGQAITVTLPHGPHFPLKPV